MNREHKYKDKDEYKDNDKDKDTERITESLTVCYIFGILMTQAFQVWWWIPPTGHPSCSLDPLGSAWLILWITQRILCQFYRAECITVSGFSYEKWNKRQREIQIYIFSARHRGGEGLNFILRKSSASYRVMQFAGITFSQKQPSFLWTQCQWTLDSLVIHLCK